MVNVGITACIYSKTFKELIIYGTISSAKVASDGVVTLTAPATGKLIIDGTLDIECNY